MPGILFFIFASCEPLMQVAATFEGIMRILCTVTEATAHAVAA